MEWSYFIIKGVRGLFWGEVTLFMLFLVMQLVSQPLTTAMYSIPLCIALVFAPFATAFVTGECSQDRAYDRECRTTRTKARRTERINVEKRSKGQKRK